MKIISVDISETKSDPLGIKNDNLGFFKRIKKLFRSRGINGCYSIEIKDIAFLHKKLKSAESKQCLKCSLSKWFFGNSLTKRFFHNSDAMISSLFDSIHNKNIEYRKISYLYHFTPTDNLDSIMKYGIKKCENYFVFLSNTRDLIGFLRWKTLMNNKTTEFCMFRIDAKQLSKNHKLYFYRKNEIVTDYVEPEFITVL